MPRRGGQDGPDPARLLALFAAALVLFNFPLIAVFDSEATVFGLPLLPVALFAIWGALIAALAWVARGRGG